MTRNGIALTNYYTKNGNALRTTTSGSCAGKHALGTIIVIQLL